MQNSKLSWKLFFLFAIIAVVMLSLPIWLTWGYEKGEKVEIDTSASIIMNATDMPLHNVRNNKVFHLRETEDSPVYVLQLMWGDHMGYRIYCDEKNYNIFDIFKDLNKDYNNSEVTFLTVIIPSCCMPAPDRLFGDEYDMNDVTWTMAIDMEYEVFSYYMDVMPDDPTLIIIDEDFNVVSLTGPIKADNITKMVDSLLETGFVDPDIRPETVYKNEKFKFSDLLNPSSLAYSGNPVVILLEMMVLGMLSSLLCPGCLMLLYASSVLFLKLDGSDGNKKSEKGNPKRNKRISMLMKLSIPFAIGNGLVFSVYGGLVGVFKLSKYGSVNGIVIYGVLIILLLYFLVKTCIGLYRGIRNKDTEHNSCSCHDAGNGEHCAHEKSSLKDKISDYFQEKLEGKNIWIMALGSGLVFGLLDSSCSIPAIIPSITLLSSHEISTAASVSFMWVMGFFSGSIIILFTPLGVVSLLFDSKKWIKILISIIFLFLLTFVIYYSWTQIYWFWGRI